MGNLNFNNEALNFMTSPWNKLPTRASLILEQEPDIWKLLIWICHSSIITSNDENTPLGNSDSILGETPKHPPTMPFVPHSCRFHLFLNHIYQGLSWEVGVFYKEALCTLYIVQGASNTSQGLRNWPSGQRKALSKERLLCALSVLSALYVLPCNWNLVKTVKFGQHFERIFFY